MSSCTSTTTSLSRHCHSERPEGAKNLAADTRNRGADKKILRRFAPQNDNSGCSTSTTVPLHDQVSYRSRSWQHLLPYDDPP